MWALWLLALLYGPARAALPAKPENISCVFYYKRNFTCTWSPERGANHTWYQVKRTHTFGRGSDTCHSTSEGPAACSFVRLITYPDNYSIQVQARNAEGTAESDVTMWNLDAIIKIDPPVILSVQPVPGIKRMLHIRWARPALAPVSLALDCTLRFRTNESDRWMEVSFQKQVDGDQAYNLTGLQAFSAYAIALQCAAQESQFWSGWSQEKMGMTEEEAPLGLDVWRVLGPAQVDGQRPVELLWKKARGAPLLERALGYLVQYFPENSTHLAQTVNTTDQHLELYLGSETYWVSVVSYNSLGRCPAATLRVPAVAEKPVPRIEAMQTCLTGDQLVVAWQSSSPDVDTWMVEWLPDLESAPLCWEPVSRARNWTIQRVKLPFWCYNISVYPMLRDRVGKPYSTQVYFQQDVPSAGPVTKVENIGVRTVTVTWKEVPKSQRNGFISNYTIFYRADSGEVFSHTVDPGTLRYGLGSLTRGTPYTLQVMASTRAGGANGTRVNFKTLSISVLEVCLITALVGGGLLILIVLMVAYGLRKPNKLKRLCWPRVPNPAQSSLATWRWDGLQTQLTQKVLDNAVTMEDRIRKPCPAPSDLIDKLVVNFGNFLEEVSSEESGKGRENILGGENNEYVTSPARPYCPPGKSSREPPTATEAAPGKPQPQRPVRPGGTSPGAEELLLPSAQGTGPARLLGDGAPNPYLKNSVTTREFLTAGEKSRCPGLESLCISKPDACRGDSAAGQGRFPSHPAPNPHCPPLPPAIPLPQPDS